jgi:Domain of unknown function (DUF4365)
VERPEQHQTDSRGRALLREGFGRLGWAVNEIEEDYGRDFEVEVFRNNKSTGIVFGVQLKSSLAPEYSANDEFISQKLDRRNALYLASELRHPTFVIIADVNRSKLFWTAPQIDSTFLADLRDGTSARSHTIRLPVSNELSSSIDRLMNVIGQVETLLAVRRLKEVRVVDFVRSVTGYVDQAELSSILRGKSDFLDLQRAKQLAVARDFNAARTIVQEVSSNARTSTITKFNALLVGEEIETLAIVRTGAPQASLARLPFDTAVAMQQLTRKGPPNLKFFALMARVAGDFSVLVEQDWGWYLNWKAHESDGDIWWRTQLLFERAALSRRIFRKYNQFVRIGQYAARSPYCASLIYAMLRACNPLSILIVRLEHEGLYEVAAAFRDSAFHVCKFVASIAGELGEEDTRARSAIAASSLSLDPNGPCFNWAREILEKITDEPTRKWGQTVVERQAQRLRSGPHPEDAYRGDSTKQIYQHMATALGIDLSNPNDEIAQLVRIGLEDMDPSRVLTDCEHLRVTLGPGGLISELLRLPAMGQKLIRCTLHKHSLTGNTLDGTYRTFQHRYCYSCPDRSPRPSHWKYSPEVEDENTRGL